jgi:CheY-like chemotaxis protein
VTPGEAENESSLERSKLDGFLGCRHPSLFAPRARTGLSPEVEVGANFVPFGVPRGTLGLRPNRTFHPARHYKNVVETIIILINTIIKIFYADVSPLMPFYLREKCRMKIDPRKNHRILLIDDNPAVHEAFRKVLTSPDLPYDLEEDASALFGVDRLKFETPIFEISSALQGQEALEMVKKSLKEDRPYALAFVDVRMPPGWDGIETISKIWSGYPDLQVVICSAYSDYSLQAMSRVLGSSDRLIILNKPFDNIEIMQLAIAMTKKWQVYQQMKIRMAELDKDVQSALSQPW